MLARTPHIFMLVVTALFALSSFAGNPFHDAVRNYDLGTIRNLKFRGANINVVEDKMTPLDLAYDIWGDDSEFVGELRKIGAVRASELNAPAAIATRVVDFVFGAPAVERAAPKDPSRLLILLAGNREVCDALFDHFGEIEAAFKMRFKVDMPWPKWKNNLIPQARIHDFFDDSYWRDALSKVGAVIRDVLPNVYAIISKDPAGPLFDPGELPRIVPQQAAPIYAPPQNPNYNPSLEPPRADFVPAGLPVAVAEKPQGALEAFESICARRDINDPIFKNLDTLRGHFRGLMATMSRADTTPWEELKHNYDPKQRCVDLFSALYAQGDLYTFGRSIKYKMVRVYNELKASEAGSLF
jgi:hypothetical protein